MRDCLIFVVLFVCSCSASSDKQKFREIEVLTEENQKEILLSSFIDNYKLIPLETTDDNLIAQVDKIQVYGDEVLLNYVESNVFCKLKDKIYVSPVFSNCIYSGGDFQVQYHLNFKNKEFPDNQNIEEQDVNDPDFNYIVKKNYYMSDRFFLFDYLEDGKRYYYVWDKNKRWQIYRNS